MLSLRTEPLALCKPTLTNWLGGHRPAGPQSYVPASPDGLEECHLHVDGLGPLSVLPMLDKQLNKASP